MGKARKAKKAKTKKHAFVVYDKASFQAHKFPQTNRRAKELQAATIPFSPENRILLVGEGDFSFALSLLINHDCTSLLATSYDSRSTLLSKYPQAASHVKDLESARQKVLYDVDATKLGRPGGGGKAIRKGDWDRIVFNFPHVGGLTKDVNRQVRHNQELLVGFMTAALPLLAPNGTIVVTTFEGEPYDLWNVRDLARHVGLKVGRTFEFRSEAYPDYKHSRTLGNVNGGGGWKGEDRSARTYVFSVSGNETAGTVKNKRRDKDSDDDE